MRSLRLILLALVLTFSSMATSLYAQSEQSAPVFFQTLDDVPLMPGLVELEDQAVYFDKPEGRIIEAYAVLNGVSQAQILEYYQSILPQFGWNARQDDQFYRSGEILEIGFIQDKNHPLVKLLIRPSL